MNMSMKLTETLRINEISAYINLILTRIYDRQPLFLRISFLPSYFVQFRNQEIL